MLEARALTLAVPGRRLCAGLDARFAPGEIWGILGGNGAGKTTLLHTLAGLRPPDAGEVCLDARPLRDHPRRALAQRLAVLLQDEAEGFWGTVEDWVRLGRFPHAGGLAADPDEDRRVRAAMARAGVEPLAHRAMATLSGGERQRARLAMVLAQDGQALLLDEPLQHLDLAAQLTVLEVLAGLARAEAKLIVMVLHDVYWVSRYCDKTLLVFGDGRIVQGETAKVLTQENMEALYHCPLTPVQAAGGRLFLPGGRA